MEQQQQSDTNKPPICLLMVGMAGSGKTTMMQRLCSEMNQRNQKSYVINLDPACAKLPYPANIDIRDTVEYKKVMQQYHLGPNGAILTCLNLFTTKFGQVLDLIDRRAAIQSKDQKDVSSAKEDKNEGDGVKTGDDENEEQQTGLDYVLIDTPGQIEIFTWSASGQIITESLATSYPTVLVYIIDTPRTTHPTTFMSNMLYACSILYKTKLPFVVVFNKTDVVGSEFVEEWMRDFDSFQEALQADSSYMGSLVLSMGLVLDEFYQHLRVVSCSAAVGTGFDEFFSAVNEAVVEYDKVYRPEFERSLKEKLERQTDHKQAQLLKLMKEFKV